MIDPKDMLANYVQAEGAPLTSIAPQTGAVDTSGTNSGNFAAGEKPAVPAQIGILFRKDDPISALIAGKLFADISNAGLKSTLKPAAEGDFERTLVSRDYGIAVGWTGSNTAGDPCEQLRMATMWFNDEANERSRIDSANEIPLFAVKIYLLAKKKIGFLNGALEGIYIKG
jgi:hypothetical protein